MGGRKCRLAFMFALTTAFFLVEITVGYVTNSMALVADSFHMLSDVVSLIVAFMSIKMSPKKWSKNTFGWARAEVLGALVNAVFLVALCFSIFVESLKRFYKPETIDEPMLILYVGVAGLVVNIIGLFLFHEHGHSHSGHGGHSHAHGDHAGGPKGSPSSSNGASPHDTPPLKQKRASGHMSHHRDHMSIPSIDDGLKQHHNNRLQYDDDEDRSSEDSETKAVKQLKHPVAAGYLNIRGVYLHILADALGSVVVIVSALIIWLTDWEYRYFVDPALSLVMVCLIMKSTMPLLVDSALILLQTVPTHIQIDSLQKKLLAEIDGVLAVHEFHVWQLAGERIIASAHIRCRSLADYMRIAEKVKEFFHNEGIHSTTIQPEFVGAGELFTDPKDCSLQCPQDEVNNCVQQQCCLVPSQPNARSSPSLPQVRIVPREEASTQTNM
ncbi:zinc transporter 1-like isoform X2 [Varroa jacobsoni]|uniref:Zinc transporter 1 n=1 Tax=Varroa destructor TaxID=109461 RepID=A0A7M7JKB5_VARDE|nr:zinc transporter 1-like isoform X2 [Varroa destructor]XP_022693316.1 zinc transporter 1-like isoform X2 [Varroa jacobsoni]